MKDVQLLELQQFSHGNFWSVVDHKWPTPLKNHGVKVSWGYDISNIWKNKKNVPKHQPALVCHFLHLNVLWHLCIKWLDVPYFSSLLDMVSELHLSDRCCSTDGAFAVDDQILGPWCIGGITEAVGFWDLIAPKSQHRCWSNPKVSTSNHGGFLDVVFHGEIPPKRWAFHGFKPCFPHFFHIKCPVLWRNPSSLCTSVASLVSSEGIWGEFATKGEQWGRRVRIYTEIQRYCIILYCIIYDIYVWICVYIYIWLFSYICLCIYIYGHTHTHARAETPPRKHWISSLVNIVCFAASSASPHRHWKQKKQWIWGPTPTQPESTSTFLIFFGGGGLVVLVSWPPPQTQSRSPIFLGGSSPQPKTGHPFVGMWWAKNLKMCMVHGYIYVMFLGSTLCKTLQTCSKNL